ncbi:hypothetical protein JM654_23450 [Microbacterium oxydans]|nr:hypothetical protein [Microbacterium oxydans]
MVLKKRSCRCSVRPGTSSSSFSSHATVRSKAPSPCLLKRELSAGASRITEAAKTSNIARDVYEAIVLDVVDLLENRQSRDVGLTASEADFLPRIG